MQYLTFNDKAIIFSYVNEEYFCIKLREYEFIKIKPITVEIVSGEDLQWGKVCNGFFSTIADLPGEGLQWGEGLQYDTGQTLDIVLLM